MRHLTPAADWRGRLSGEDREFFEQSRDVTRDRQGPGGSATDDVLPYAVVGGGDAGFTFTSRTARSFAEALRVSDGSGHAGWAGAHEALRVLALAGESLRLTRLYLSRVAAVDPPTGVCTWGTASRAARRPDVRHYAQLADLIRATSLPSAPFEGAAFARNAAPAFRQLGVSARLLPAPATMEGVQNIVRAHPDGLALLSVEYLRGGLRGTQPLLAASRGAGVRFVGRAGGRSAGNLSELEGAHPGVSRGVPAGEVLVVEQGQILGADDREPGLFHAIGLEVRTLPLCAPKAAARTAAGGGSWTSSARQTAVLEARSGGVRAAAGRSQREVVW